MPPKIGHILSSGRALLRTTVTGPQILAFLPALTLGAYWYGGEAVLLFVALLFPALLALGGAFEQAPSVYPRDHLTGLTNRDGIIEALNHAIREGEDQGLSTAAMVITLDEFTSITERFGARATDDILCKVADRLVETCRDADMIGRLQGTSFSVALCPVLRVDLEAMIQLSGRIQAAIAEPISMDATTLYVTASIGFSLPGRVNEQTGEALLDAAECAMVDARRNGPGAIRAYSAEMKSRITQQHALMQEVGAALENGEIRPWFQPQISTDTGRVTGFEALARWVHPERGMIPPSEFLPAIEAAGLLERLSEVMLFQSLSAMRSWDGAKAKVPTVGVNFSSDELRNPNLVEKVRWEIDRFELTPDRLVVEILESVVADGDDDVIARNIAELAKLGCAIDLDDFGTGHASIGHIRRFAVGRIKIDRSFVMKVDQDQDQQKMVAAILTMAERLELETLAEGVESTGEHAMLSQLGCGHVQGFGIARPMPFEDTLAWVDKHNRKLSKAPRIHKKTG